MAKVSDKGKKMTTETTKAAEPTKAAKAPQNGVQTAETVVHIPLNKIYADYDWNIRNQADVLSEVGDGVQDEGKPEAAGMAALAENIHEVGQDTAVIIAAVTGGKTLSGVKTTAEYELIAGFRRFTAIGHLNSEVAAKERTKKGDTRTAVPNVPVGCIAAVVRSFATSRDARILNARENTARSNLKPPDLVRLVRELTHSPNGVKALTQTEVGIMLGIQQGYISRLYRIGALPAPVLSHWRSRTPIAGVEMKADWKQLQIAEMVGLAQKMHDESLSPGDVIKLYVQLLDGEPAEGGEKQTKDPNEKIEAALKQVGMLVGALVREGVIQPGNMVWGALMGPSKAGYLLDTGKKELTQARKAELTHLINDAYHQALSKAPAGEKVAE